MPIKLNLTSEKINELINTYGTPLQIYDGRLIIENQNNFISIMKSHFSNFKQFFAVKALPNPHVLKLLIENGSFLDCSSKTELEIAKSLGLSGEQIMFTSNYTSKEDLKFAKDMNVIINLDDISLIDDLHSLGEMPELLCFRLNPGIGKTDSETLSNVLGGIDAKFGIPTFQIIDAYKKAKAFGVKRFGLHMMTGSNVLNIEYWKELLDILFENIHNINKFTDITIEFINIGGGIGIPYIENHPKFDVVNFSSILREKITELTQKYNLHEPALFMENGRFITGPYGWLLSRCNVIKNTYAKYYGLDACMANLMRPGMYGAYHHITILDKDNINMETANVVGTLCENNDWFAKNRLLPKASVGDIFIIHDTGAHSHSMGFQYNGKLRAPELLILSNNDIKIIRRKENYNDYISTVI